MSTIKTLTDDLKALQKRLESYEEKMDVAISSDDDSSKTFVQSRIGYYSEEIKRVRDFILEVSRANLAELIKENKT